MSRMRCTELASYGSRSVIEVMDMDAEKVIKYVLAYNFNNAKPYGDKWENGDYYNVDEILGLKADEQLKAAMLKLYDIEQPKVSYDRVLEFAKAYFTNMDIDEDMEFEGFDDSANCERYWTYLGNTYTNKSGVTVYFWLRDKNYTLENLDNFINPEQDGKMLIYTNKAKEEGFPQAYDYLVMIGNDEEIVGIEGADLGTLKKYANSVKF